MKKIITTEKAFTLIELMIVVAIIGVLSVIAIPTFDSYQQKAKQTEAKVSLSAVYTGEKAFAAEFNTYTANLEAIGYSATPKNYVVGFGAANTIIVPPATATVANKEAMLITGIIGKFDAKAVGCATDNKLPVAAVVAQTTFIAGATGNIGETACDQWTINEKKVLDNL